VILRTFPAETHHFTFSKVMAWVAAFRCCPIVLKNSASEIGEQYSFSTGPERALIESIRRFRLIHYCAKTAKFRSSRTFSTQSPPSRLWQHLANSVRAFVSSERLGIVET
jgi:hypothetical protein